ncbi:hypothetical protein BRC91_11355 [Halobacteriales archaeon QS_4_62_28]|nr:MAG: hypothetical protein BRC91_11355 [Halobacteriales archaeon QS_4_62_28]
MSRVVRPGVSALPSSRPDLIFRIVAGCYVATLAVPVGLVVATEGGVTGAAPLYGVFLASGSLCLLAGMWIAGRIDGAAVRLGASRLRWLPALLGVALALGSLASSQWGGGVTWLGFFAGIVAAIVGFVLAVMAQSRYAQTLLDVAGIDAEWRAGWPDRAKRRLIAIAGLLALLALVSMGVEGLGLVTHHGDDLGWLWYVGQILFPASVGLVNYAQERDFSASAEGLVADLNAIRRYYAWDEFSGYSRTGDAIVCHRPRRIDFRFALADLDDPEAVEVVLDRYLDRTEVATV